MLIKHQAIQEDHKDVFSEEMLWKYYPGFLRDAVQR